MKLLWKKSGGPYRVYRGGGWNYGGRDLRASSRVRSDPGFRGVDLGFRCSRPSRQLTKKEKIMSKKNQSRNISEMFIEIAIPAHTNVPLKTDVNQASHGNWPIVLQATTEEELKVAKVRDRLRGTVFVDALLCMDTPVTNELWNAVMPKMEKANMTSARDKLRPVVNVSWFDALEFCNELSVRMGLQPRYEFKRDRDELVEVWENEEADGYRLLNDHEWLVVKNGGEHVDTFEPIDDYAWHWDNIGEDKQAQPVRGKKPNGFGIYDILGNVWTWLVSEY